MIVSVKIGDTTILTQGSIEKVCKDFNAVPSLDYISSINDSLLVRGINAKCTSHNKRSLTLLKKSITDSQSQLVEIW